MPGMMAAACYAARAWREGRQRAARWCAALFGALLRTRLAVVALRTRCAAAAPPA